MKKITKNKVTKKPVKVKAKKKVFGDYSFNELNAMKEGEAQKLYNIQEFGKVMYSGYKTGDMERSILDCLGATALKKRLGAFFTPKDMLKFQQNIYVML